MSTSPDLSRFDELLSHFDTLNPEIAELAMARLTAEARLEPAAAYERLQAAAERLIPAFLASPVKREGRQVMGEYYNFVDRATKRLIADGTLAPDTESPEPTTAARSVALVPERFFDSTRWCLATSTDLIPREVLTAADAVQRRHLLVDSILEPIFTLMLELAPERALAWQLALARQDDPPVDPDIARDLLRAWDSLETTPAEALKQAMLWSADERAGRHWPAVVEEADDLLRRHALIAWNQDPPRLGAAEQLSRCAPFRNGERLIRWLHRAIAAMGASVDFFCDQSERLGTGAKPDSAAATDDWRRIAMFREINWLHRMLNPLLVLADLYLRAPTGSYEFALAIFGFTDESRQTWKQHLADRAHKAVHRVFLNGIRHGQKPGPSIHMLCFGDESLEAELVAELDLFTQDFDSLRQRDIVIDRLAAVYASYKEDTLLASEIGRRYRRLMRVLHEDNLRRLLTPEQMTEVEGMRDVLTTLSTIAASCRRYVNARRATTIGTAELIAAEMDFILEIRAKRAAIIHHLLGL